MSKVTFDSRVLEPRLSLLEATQFCGYANVATIMRYIKLGDLTPFVSNGVRYLPLVQVITFINERTRRRNVNKKTCK